jgi:hypothetical protein
MKSISSVFLFFLLLFSCGKGRNESTVSGDPSNSDFSESSAKIHGNTIEALDIQIPMSNEQFKKWIPEQVGAMMQRKLLIGHKQGMKMSGAIATYQEKGQAMEQISMEILDGAGPIGAVMLKSIAQKLTLDYEEQTDTGYSRIYEREGVRVWEKLDSSNQFVEIEYVTKGRFHFIFKGHQIEMEELWVFVRQVNQEMN